MAWPASLELVRCIGFSRPLLPILVEAIDNKHVEWHDETISLIAGEGAAEFSYLGFRYEILESYELVYAIKQLGKEYEALDDDGEVLSIHLERWQLEAEVLIPPSNAYGTW